MKAAKKNLLLRSATGAYRTETFRDEEYIVVPVVGLVEGVIWPVNAEAPELVLEEEFAVAPGGWNGRPVFNGHPQVDGEEVSGNTPEILENEQIGYVFNAGITDHQLTMEAWISPAMCENAGEDALNVLERAKTGQPIEISTGVLVVSEEKTGSFNGKKFYSIWRDITPDHLALLHEGDEGACSITMGCGVRAAISHIITAGGKIVAVRTKAEREAARKAGAAKLFALVAKLRGAQITDQEAEKAAELIAFSTMSTLLTQVETTLGEAKTHVAGLIADETAEGEGDAEETIEDARLDALYALAGSSIDTMYKVLSLVGGCLADNYDEGSYPRYMASAKKDLTTVQAVHDTAVMLGAACDPESAGMKAAAGRPCSCGTKTTANRTGDIDMTKEARITALMSNEHNPLKDKTALEALPEASLTALESHCTATKDAADRAATERQTLEGKVNTLVAAASKPKTTEEFLATAPEEIRTIVTKFNAGQVARKTELVTKLKANTSVASAYTEAELAEMTVDQLEKIAKAAQIEVAASHIDFSGLSVAAPASSLTATEKQAAPAPPDFSAKIRAQGAAGMKQSARPAPPATT